MDPREPIVEPRLEAAAPVELVDVRVRAVQPAVGIAHEHDPWYMVLALGLDQRRLHTSLGTDGGSNAHNLWPCRSAFQALVPSGSMWMYEPERAGPSTNLRDTA